MTAVIPLSEQLSVWLAGDERKTLGSLVHAFGEKSFAVLFVVLLAVPALPLPTAGLTHVFEAIAALIAIELIVGRREFWLPERWRAVELGGPRRQRFIAGLMKLIRRLKRFSRPRLRFVFGWRFADVAVVLLVIGLALEIALGAAAVHGITLLF